MAPNKSNKPILLREGYQPDRKGYQAQSNGDAKPQKLKPPKGGSAIQSARPAPSTKSL